MKTLPLGHTGVEVSALCLGAMFFGTKNDKAASYNILDRYKDIRESRVAGLGESFV